MQLLFAGLDCRYNTEISGVCILFVALVDGCWFVVGVLCLVVFCFWVVGVVNVLLDFLFAVVLN